MRLGWSAIVGQRAEQRILRAEKDIAAVVRESQVAKETAEHRKGGVWGQTKERVAKKFDVTRVARDDRVLDGERIARDRPEVDPAATAVGDVFGDRAMKNHRRDV